MQVSLMEFYNQTIEAIKEFQAYAGLSVDGDAGPNTIAKMNSWQLGREN